MMKKYNTLIVYLDRVVINTLSGELYPTNYFDMKMNFGFLKFLNDYSPQRVVLFVNRTIIHRGSKISNSEFWSKLNFIKTGIKNYLRLKGKDIDLIALYSISQDWMLGLDNENPQPFINAIPRLDLEDTIFIGPNDGYGKDFCERNNIFFTTFEEIKNEDQVSVSETRPSHGTGGTNHTDSTDRGSERNRDRGNFNSRRIS